MIELNPDKVLDGEDPGTDEHMAKVFSACKETWDKTSVCDKIASSRWWAFECKGINFMHLKTLTLYVAVYMGYKRGWGKTLEYSPLLTHGTWVALPADEANSKI